MDFLLKKIEQILRYQRKWKKWQKVVASLACVVVFITTYALILPAITMDRDEAQSQGGISWEEVQEAEETVASADAQGADQDGILSAEEANLIAGSELDVSEEQAEMDVVGEENSVGEGTLNREAASERPATIFDEVAGDVTVHVEAPEGAFPVGTTMKVEPVEDAQVMAAVQNAVEDPVTKVSAVDIIFLDASGNEIEPAAEIKVSMSSTVMENVEQPVIVHVDEEGVGETVESEQVDGAVVFESDRFSVYVIVGTEIVEKQIQTASGDTLKVTVEVNNENDIARLEGLRVNELNSDSDKYWEAYNAVVEAKAAENENFDEETLGFFATDIELLDANGEAFEPNGSVKVTMELISLPADEGTLVSTMEVQHLEEKDGNLDVQTVATSNEINKIDEVITAEFSVDSFSTFTLTWTDDGSGTIVSDDDAALTLNLQESGSTYATVKVHYVGKSGDNYFNIERPAGLNVSENAGISVEDIAALLAKEIEGFTYLDAHYAANEGEEINAVVVSRTSSDTTESGYTSIGTTGNNGRINNSTSLPAGVSATETFYSDANGNTQIYWITGIMGSQNNRFHTRNYALGNGTRYNGSVYVYRSNTVTNYTHTLSFDNENINPLTNSGTSAVWENAADIYLVYESHVETASATIHFGTISDGTFTEFEDEKVANLDTSAASISLANNFSGVSYLGANYSESEEYSDDTTTILPELYKTDTGWEAVALTESSDGSTVQTRFHIAEGSHIFVCYTTGSGSNPSGADDASVPSPTTTKTVTSNGDGTYTIQLDVQGTTVQEDESHYANVLIVLDATTSMNTGDRWTNAKLAVDTLVSTLTEDRTAQGGKDNSANANKIDFSLVTFGPTAQIRTGTWGTTWTKDNAAFKTWCASNALAVNTVSGTNWEAGLYIGYDALTQRPDNDPTYVIFVTDGDPYGHGQTSYTSSNNLNTNASYANDEAYDIAHYANTSLYGIFTSESADASNASLTRLRNVISDNGGVKTIFASPSTIQSEFAAIAETILNQMGANNVSVDDGVPSLSSVSADVVGQAGGFKYQISTDGTNYSDWAQAPGASFSDDNGVTWDLSAIGTVKTGSYYRLRFTVWPSQEAYDLIADLNNGIVTMTDDDLEAAGIAENDGVYSLKTNTHLKTNYTFQNTTYTDEPDELAQEAMLLPTETISVEKIWKNLIDTRTDADIDGLKLILTKDGNDYLPISVSAPNWKEDNIYISCGQIADGEVIEYGHDYYVTEEAVSENQDKTEYWEIDSDVYRPMIIEGTAHILIEKELSELNGKTEGVDYFILPKLDSDGQPIEGKFGYYLKDDETTTMSATNERVSWLNLSKVIDDQSADSGADADTLFEYTVTINEAVGDEVLFSVFGINGVDTTGTNGTHRYLKNVVTSATSVDYEDDGVINTYYQATSGNSFTLKIKQGWSVRFLNLATGTTYTIQETNIPTGFECEGATAVETHYVGTAYADRVVDTDGGFPKTTASLTDTIGGTINQNNTDYTVTYTNKWEPSNELTVRKIWNTGEEPFVTDHGTIKVALYRDGAVIDGTVKEIIAPTTTVKYENVSSLDTLEVREVIETIVGEGDEAVTIYTPIDANGLISVSGETTTLGSNATDTYVVTYTVGTPSISEGTTTRTDTITNTMPQLTVNKQDMSGNQLKDAVFKLTGSDGSTALTGYGTITSTDASSGNLLNNIYLSNGTYYLVETDAPDGYNKLTYKVKIVVSGDAGNSRIITATTDPESTMQITDQTATNNLLYTFNVHNSNGVELPMTGGPGTLLYTLSGLALMLGAALMYGFRMRRRERRLN